MSPAPFHIPIPGAYLRQVTTLKFVRKIIPISKASFAIVVPVIQREAGVHASWVTCYDGVHNVRRWKREMSDARLSRARSRFALNGKTL